MARIDELLRYLKDHGGSDLHLAANMAPRIRQSGSLTEVDGWSVLGDDELRTLMREVTNDTQWASYDDKWGLDFAYGLPGIGRRRENRSE